MPATVLTPLQNVYIRRTVARTTVVKRFREIDIRRAEHELEVLLLLPKRSPHFVRPLRSCVRPTGSLWIEMEHVPAKSRRFFASTLAEMQRYMRTLLEVRNASLSYH